MGTPPNPFDQAAVDSYLAEQQSREAEKQAAVAPGTTNPFTPPVRDDDPAVEARVMLDYWARRGPDVMNEAMVAIAGGLEAVAAGIERDGTDADGAGDMLTVAAMSKRLQAASGAVYTAARGALWRWVGSKAGTTTLPDGRSFQFKPQPETTRRTNYNALEEKYPEVYAHVVTISPTNPNGTGAFYIKDGKKK